MSHADPLRRYPHLKGHLTDLLIGDLWKDELDVVFPLMAAMKAEQSAGRGDPATE